MSARSGERFDDAVASLGRRGRDTVTDQLRKLRPSLLVAAQAGLAAALAWYVAKDVLHNPQPVFAPAIAVSTIASSIGHRIRRTVYVIAGVTVGIVVADLLVALIGTGYLTIGLIVAVAILLAGRLSGEGGFLAQVGGSAMVIAVLAPASTDVAVPRLVDGTVGGVVGVVVSLIVLPLDPIYRVRRAAGPPLSQLAEQLVRASDAVATRDAALAKDVIDRLRAVKVDELEATLAGAAEVVAVSPLRWRQRRELQGWQHGAGLLLRTLEVSRPLGMSLRTSIRYQEPLPDSLVDALRCLAFAVRHVRDGFSPQSKPAIAVQRAAMQAAGQAEAALKAGLGTAGATAVGQIKVMSVNVMRATGLSKPEAEHRQDVASRAYQE
ncbi:FUSC family protein [Micromonospora sp. NPDC047074]|uniref:FUSC family protein n=1 Tax=Micromonospora sp. NPDC047074 TaxID=3154339 RepID=UPI0033CC829D